MKRLLDKQGTVTEWFHWDPSGDGDTFWIETVEDVDGLVRQAKDDADNANGMKADGMRLEAHIPRAVYDQAVREGWVHDRAAWKRWANDPDNKAFRVSYGGRIKRL